MPKTTRSKASPRTRKTAKGRGTNARKGSTTKGRSSSRSASGRATSGRATSRTQGVNVTLREKGTTVEGNLGGRPMHSITGQLVVDGAADAISWYTKVFGAKELARNPYPDGRIMHAVLSLGDSAFMISDSFGKAPAELNGAYLHIQDKGLDAMWEKALATGAKPVLPLANQFWGDRYGQLRDPWGQIWSLGWPAKMTEAEKKRLQQEAMSTMAARQS